MTSNIRPFAEARRLRTVVWIVALATVGLIFDGYDLVIYGAVVSTFLRDPSHIGNVTPAIAGLLGSYALVGVMVGALLAGLVGDILGRRKVMLISYAWFSVGMALIRFFLPTGAYSDTSAAVVATSEPMPRPVAKRSQPKAVVVVAVAVNAMPTENHA